MKRNQLILLGHMDFGTTTMVNSITHEAIELQNEGIVLDNKDRIGIEKEKTFPISAFPVDDFDYVPDLIKKQNKPFYYQFSKNHKKERK